MANVLLGNAIPKHLIGTTDSNFYVHYSELSTVEANWDLPTLGRRDVGANVFAFVAQETHDKIQTLVNPPLSQTFLNTSYPGPFNSVNVTSLPVPNTKLVVNGRKVLESIVKIWGSPELQRCTPYTGSVEVPSGANPPVIPKGCWFIHWHSIHSVIWPHPKKKTSFFLNFTYVCWQSVKFSWFYTCVCSRLWGVGELFHLMLWFFPLNTLFWVYPERRDYERSWSLPHLS